jgi:PAS domain S-box-containing protein
MRDLPERSRKWTAGLDRSVLGLGLALASAPLFVWDLSALSFWLVPVVGLLVVAHSLVRDRAGSAALLCGLAVGLSAAAVLYVPTVPTLFSALSSVLVVAVVCAVPLGAANALRFSLAGACILVSVAGAIEWSSPSLLSAIGLSVLTLSVTVWTTKKLSVPQEAPLPAAALAKAAEVGLFEIDLETDRVRCDEQLAALLHAPGLPKTLDDFMASVHSDDRPGLFSVLNDSSHWGQRAFHEFRIAKGDETRWLCLIAGVDAATSKSLRGLVFDATARHRTEDRRAAKATLYEKIAENIPGVLYQMIRFDDGTRHVPFVSEKVYEVFGYTREEVYKNANLLIEVIHPDDRVEKERLADRSIRELALFDWTGRILRPDGKVKWVHIVGKPAKRDGGGVIWDGVTLDVTGEKLAEIEHKRTRERLEWLVRSSPVVIYSCSGAAPHPVTFISDNAEELLGIPVDACLSDPYYLQKRVHPNDQHITQDALEQISSLGTVAVEYRMRNAADEYRWVRDELRYVYDAGAIVGTIVDVTERRQAQDAARLSDERFRAMSHASPLGVFMTDPNGGVVYVNEKLGEIVGRPQPDLLGDRLFALVHPEDADRVQEGIAHSIRARSSHSVQCRIQRPDHAVIWCSVKTGQIVDRGELVGLVGTIEDVTERFELEQMSEQARIEAERANQAKSAFLSRISHELRTPLHAMLGFAQLLQMGKLTDDQRESVENILASGNHLLSLIRDVLDIARAESGELGVTVAPISLYPVVEEAVQMLQSLADQRAISVELRLDGRDHVSVLADRQRLRQVLLNVLSNAIKYNRREGTVVVTSDVRPDGYANVTINDSGAGIPPDKVERLFTPFDRLGAEGSSVEGTGLGLALTKRLVEAMGGHLTVESDSRSGTSVSVSLRYAGSRPSGQAVVEIPLPTEPGATGERTVLLIEDNDSNIRLMQTVFQARPNYRLAIEKSGRSGLEWSLQNRPDLVLLDLNLPDMVGARLLERLKAELESTEVIVISATAEGRQIERMRRLGAAAYLTKPLDVSELLRIVDSVLGAVRR